jgi:hypothetical protein
MSTPTAPIDGVSDVGHRRFHLLSDISHLDGPRRPVEPAYTKPPKYLFLSKRTASCTIPTLTNSDRAHFGF